jgi:hypothetical protein
MLSLISLGRGLWQKFQAAHPVIRWGGALLVGLIALELIAQEAISLYVHMQTARATIEQKNAEALQAATQAKAMSTPPGRSTLEIQREVGNATRLEACRRMGVAEGSCPPD